MDAQMQIFGLMKAAEDQQAAVKAALDSLATERQEFAKAREQLVDVAHWQVEQTQKVLNGVAGIGQEIKQAANEAIPAISEAASAAAGGAVRKSLAGASETAANALEVATDPILSGLTGVVRAGESAADKLNAATDAFGWKWATMAGGVAVALLLVVLVIAYMLTWLERDTVTELRNEQAALQADIAQMQVQAAELEKRGGRIVMTECGGRLCIEASANQGKNKDGSPAAMGSWQRDIKNGGGKVSLVIPKGY